MEIGLPLAPSARMTDPGQCIYHLAPILFALFLIMCAIALAAVSIVLPDFSDLELLAAVFALAGAYLLTRHLLRRRREWIVVDGSNVLHWRDNQPKL